MTQTVPLVRASGLGPMLIWARDNARETDALLRSLRLPVTVLAEPDRLIPLIPAVRVGLAMMASEGPDIGCRAVSDVSPLQLGSLGRVMLGARTPRKAYERLMLYFPHHSTHESLAMDRGAGITTVRYMVRMPLTGSEQHILQQYVAALLRALLGGTGRPGRRLIQVEMTPHPQHCLAHLAPHLDGNVCARTDGHLVITIPDAALDRPYYGARPHPPERGDWPVVREGTMAGSIRLILPGLLEYGRPTLAGLADLARLTPRTLQRRLADEGTSVSELVDEARRSTALARIRDMDEPIGDIAAGLGFSDHSSFTRAVRRWTHRSPRQLRTG